MHVEVAEYDTWKTMRRLEREYEELGKTELSFLRFVMAALQCPTMRDAQWAVANYNASKQEGRDVSYLR